jgi:hypothetical protein
MRHGKRKIPKSRTPRTAALQLCGKKFSTSKIRPNVTSNLDPRHQKRRIDIVRMRTATLSDAHPDIRSKRWPIQARFWLEWGSGEWWEQGSGGVVS